jgi:N-terminal domain of galactosyltransferase/N-terminal region of glycosyl transferase group 7
MSPLLIFIPYRNREDHLRQCVPHLERFIQSVPIRIVVLEQADSKPFNRGKLLNAGYSLLKTEAECVCFHDVDLLPMDANCDYTPRSTTCHLGGRLEQYGYRRPYPEYFGGVIITPVSDFKKVNGFSNDYWGWGAEDDDLYVRYQMAGVTIEWRPGVFKSLPHSRVSGPIDNRRRLVQTLEHATQVVERDPAAVTRIRRAQERLSQGLTNSLPPIDYLSEGLCSVTYDVISRAPLCQGIAFSPSISPRHELIRFAL